MAVSAFEEVLGRVTGAARPGEDGLGGAGESVFGPGETGLSAGFWEGDGDRTTSDGVTTVGTTGAIITGTEGASSLAAKSTSSTDEACPPRKKGASRASEHPEGWTRLKGHPASCWRTRAAQEELWASFWQGGSRKILRGPWEAEEGEANDGVENTPRTKTYSSGFSASMMSLRTRSSGKCTIMSRSTSNGSPRIGNSFPPSKGWSRRTTISVLVGSFTGLGMTARPETPDKAAAAGGGRNLEARHLEVAGLPGRRHKNVIKPEEQPPPDLLARIGAGGDVCLAAIEAVEVDPGRTRGTPCYSHSCTGTCRESYWPRGSGLRDSPISQCPGWPPGGEQGP